ncbi:MAG: hypothetical protein QM765_23385 [Myxococcales bacterium]
MSQRQKKQTHSATPSKPAGIQSMDEKLYELVQQAVRKLAAAQAGATS